MILKLNGSVKKGHSTTIFQSLPAIRVTSVSNLEKREERTKEERTREEKRTEEKRRGSERRREEEKENGRKAR